MFASASAVRAGLASGKVATVTGDDVTVADADQVAFDVIDADHSVIVGSYNERIATVAAWKKELADAGITTGTMDESALDQTRVSVAMSVADATTKLETAKLFAARRAGHAPLHDHVGRAAWLGAHGIHGRGRDAAGCADRHDRPLRRARHPERCLRARHDRRPRGLLVHAADHDRGGADLARVRVGVRARG